jgi:hypothetical protein
MSRTPKPKEYKFKIDVFTPDTLPMARLAEYMANLAKLLGEPSKVHFLRLEKGSTVLVQRVDTDAVPKIQQRIANVKKGDDSNEELGHFKNLNEMLRDDNCIAELLSGGRRKLLKFPGRDEKLPISYGSISQEGTIEGIPIWVGGKSKFSHITIEEEGREFPCEASREVATSIARFLYTTPLRLTGKGRWHRDAGGEWILDSFRISHFTPLKHIPLSEVVAELQAVEGSEWNKLDDPWAELHKLRHGTDGDSE